MAQTSITLTASMRSNLSSLKSIQKQMDTTQERLSTGKKVNSAIDNASSYYQARSLTNRANDLNSLLDSMGQGIQTIQAANEGIEAITSYVEQLKSVAASAFALDSTSTNYKTELANYQEQYNDILKEIGTLAKDSSYQGVNLLKGNDLTVMFNEQRSHSLVVNGDNITEEMARVGAEGFAWTDASSSSDVGTGTINWVAELDKTTTEYTVAKFDGGNLGDGTSKAGKGTHYTEDGAGNYTVVTEGTTLADDVTYYTITESKTVSSGDTYAENDDFTDASGDWKVTDVGDTVAKETAAAEVDKALDAIASVNSYLRSYATELGNNFSIIETRQNFTEALVDVLETGSDNLVLADMNEESANYLALQTRQQLAVNSLSLASQSAQSVLSLF